MNTSKQEKQSIKAFNEHGSIQEFKIPQGMIVQTIYRPEANESLIPSFAKFGNRVAEQAKTNDPAVIIICAPIDPTIDKPYKYFLSTQNTLDKVGMGNRASVQKACNAQRAEYMMKKQDIKRNKDRLFSLVA